MLTITELHVALTTLVNTQIALMQSLGHDTDPRVGDLIIAQRELFDAVFATIVALESRQAQHLEGIHALAVDVAAHIQNTDIHPLDRPQQP